MFVEFTINHLISGCGAGYFHTYPHSSSCECEPCPIGTYNERDHSQSCTECPEGFTTMQEGSASSSECLIGK